MSTRRSSEFAAGAERERPLTDQRETRRARRRAERRRRLARLDVGLGVAFGLILILITPGLAIAALFALLAILLCVASLAAGWYVRRRRTRSARGAPRAVGPAVGGGPDGRRRLGYLDDDGAGDQPGRW